MIDRDIVIKRNLLNYMKNTSIKLFLALAVFSLFISPLQSYASEVDIVAEQVIAKERTSKKESTTDTGNGDIIAYASAGIATLTIYADPTTSTVGSSGLSYDLGTCIHNSQEYF
jgi:hypothetical protein